MRHTNFTRDAYLEIAFVVRVGLLLLDALDMTDMVVGDRDGRGTGDGSESNGGESEEVHCDYGD